MHFRESALTKTLTLCALSGKCVNKNIYPLCTFGKVLTKTLTLVHFRKGLADAPKFFNVFVATSASRRVVFFPKWTPSVPSLAAWGVDVIFTVSIGMTSNYDIILSDICLNICSLSLVLLKKHFGSLLQLSLSGYSLCNLSQNSFVFPE